MIKHPLHLCSKPAKWCMLSAWIVWLALPAFSAPKKNTGKGENDWLPTNKKTFMVDVGFNLSAGPRTDTLNWNIGYPAGIGPNILSELKWTDVKSTQLNAEAYVIWPETFAVMGRVGGGTITSGDNQDSDYSGNNRTFEFSRSNNGVDGDSVNDVSLAFGYPIQFGDANSAGTFTFLLGHSLHQQNLNMVDGFQTIDTSTNNFYGSFPGLNSSYDAEWKGPWVGMDLRFEARERSKEASSWIETFLALEFHLLDYHAEANWNLREDFEHPVSFIHDGNGSGWRFNAGFNLWIFKNAALSASYNYYSFSIENGIDTVFSSDGDVGRIRLNEVNWNAHAFNLGFALRY